eukprot:403351525
MNLKFDKYTYNQTIKELQLISCCFQQDIDLAGPNKLQIELLEFNGYKFIQNIQLLLGKIDPQFLRKLKLTNIRQESITQMFKHIGGFYNLDHLEMEFCMAIPDFIETALPELHKIKELKTENRQNPYINEIILCYKYRKELAKWGDVIELNSKQKLEMIPSVYELDFEQLTIENIKGVSQNKRGSKRVKKHVTYPAFRRNRLQQNYYE